MGIEIPGIRPALISKASAEILEELRGFRHVFRHAYGRRLEPEKVELVLKKGSGVTKTLHQRADGFPFEIQDRLQEITTSTDQRSHGMPIYEYRCKECGSQFEMLQRLGEESEGLRCPQCGEVKVQRLLSIFAAAGHGNEPQMSNGGGTCCGGGGCGCRH